MAYWHERHASGWITRSRFAVPQTGERSGARYAAPRRRRLLRPYTDARLIANVSDRLDAMGTLIRQTAKHLCDGATVIMRAHAPAVFAGSWVMHIGHRTSAERHIHTTTDRLSRHALSTMAIGHGR